MSDQTAREYNAKLLAERIKLAPVSIRVGKPGANDQGGVPPSNKGQCDPRATSGAYYEKH